MRYIKTSIMIGTLLSAILHQSLIVSSAVTEVVPIVMPGRIPIALNHIMAKPGLSRERDKVKILGCRRRFTS
jgi:hypothetical protein